MTDPWKKQGDSLEGFRTESFKHVTYPGMDALVAFIPQGREIAVNAKQAFDDAGEGRWFPCEGGWKVTCPYAGQSFDRSLFVVQKGAWTHEHCDVCAKTISVGDSCWVAETEEACVIICDTCCSRRKNEEGTG